MLPFNFRIRTESAVSVGSDRAVNTPIEGRPANAEVAEGLLLDARDHLGWRLESATAVSFPSGSDAVPTRRSACESSGEVSPPGSFKRHALVLFLFFCLSGNYQSRGLEKKSHLKARDELYKIIRRSLHLRLAPSQTENV